MQPAASPNEGIHSILSRFEAWSGKLQENGAGQKNGDGVREIPMEEAMRQLRSRRARTNPAQAETGAAQTSTLAAKAEPETKRAAATAVVPPAQVAPTVDPAAMTKAVARRAKSATQLGTRPVAREPARKPLRATEAKLDSSPRKTADARRHETKKPVKARSHALKPSTRPFRDVLANSLEHHKAREPERLERVSVRLSREEERQLQRCATAAGLTVSAYLRQRALPEETQPSAKAARRFTAARQTREKAPVEASFVASPAEAKSGSVLGGWLALLRQRFLASPVRFAERA